VKEWIRLRNAEGSFSLNYKNWHYTEKGESNHCEEYESGIESLEKVKKILKALDFRSLVIVDKKRKIWRYKDYEISLDSVKSLGDFVEVEYKGTGKEVDPDKIAKEMVAFLKSAGCGSIKKNYLGYPFLLLFGEEAEWEEQ
jgi:adenylate cyclase, class 2